MVDDIRDTIKQGMIQATKLIPGSIERSQLAKSLGTELNISAGDAVIIPNTDPTFTSTMLGQAKLRKFTLDFGGGANYRGEIHTNTNLVVYHPCPVCGMQSESEEFNDWHDNVCSGRFWTEYEAV